MVLLEDASGVVGIAEGAGEVTGGVEADPGVPDTELVWC
jgi:hypothetical protein